MKIEISDAIQYIGVDDTTIDLFESQYVCRKCWREKHQIIWLYLM